MMFDTRKVVSYNTEEQLLLRWPTVPSILMFSSLCFSKIFFLRRKQVVFNVGKMNDNDMCATQP